jgi:hypothetical protein
MNRRSFFRLGFGTALSPVADKWLSVLPVAPAIQKMDEPMYTYYTWRGDSTLKHQIPLSAICKPTPDWSKETVTLYMYVPSSEKI